MVVISLTQFKSATMILLSVSCWLLQECSWTCDRALLDKNFLPWSFYICQENHIILTADVHFINIVGEMWRKRWNWIKLFTQASPSSLISYKRKLQVIIHLLLVFFIVIHNYLLVLSVALKVKTLQYHNTTTFQKIFTHSPFCNLKLSLLCTVFNYIHATNVTYSI